MPGAPSSFLLLVARRNTRALQCLQNQCVLGHTSKWVNILPECALALDSARRKSLYFTSFGLFLSSFLSFFPLPVPSFHPFLFVSLLSSRQVAASAYAWVVMVAFGLSGLHAQRLLRGLDQVPGQKACMRVPWQKSQKRKTNGILKTMASNQMNLIEMASNQ